MAVVAAVLITSVLTTAVVATQQGRTAKAIAGAQLEQGRLDKESIVEQADLDLQSRRAENRRIQSAQRAKLATTGFDIGTGSFLENLVDTRTTLEINALRKRRSEGIRAQRIGSVGATQAGVTRARGTGAQLQTVAGGIRQATSLLL